MASAINGASAAATVAASQPEDQWREFTARFIEEYFKSQPFFAATQGRHEFDGQMPDLSAAGIAAQVQRLKNWRATAGGFDAARLDQAQRF